MNDLTEDDRKVLTELIGECWHEWRYIRGPVLQETFYCQKCGEHCKGMASKEQTNRTFLTGNDMVLVKEAIEGKGKWSEFRHFAMIEHIASDASDNGIYYDQWLIYPPRFNKLASDWWRNSKKEV